MAGLDGNLMVFIAMFLVGGALRACVPACLPAFPVRVVVPSHA
jgi:hypothetical protein